MRTGRRLAAAAVVLAALCAGPPDASAAGGACRSMVDPADQPWFVAESGQVQGGAFDLYGFVFVASTGYGTLPGCDGPAGARQLGFQEETVGPLRVSRKVYMPASGTPFVRWLDVLRNPAANPVTGTISFRGSLAAGGITNVVHSSDGDADVDIGANADFWTVSDGTDTIDIPDNRAAAHVWDGAGATPDRNDGIYSDDGFSDVWSDGEGTVRARYLNVTVPGGSSIAYMHVAATRGNAAQGKAAAEYLSTGPLEVFQDLTVAELGLIRNWRADDVDADGSANTQDNCPFNANVGQADLDGDGSGDTCDGDIDGDGVSNDVEAASGSNPSAGDTDGDGVRDGADECPLRSGLGADGCPRFDVPPAPAADTTPAATAISGVPGTMRLRAFRAFRARATTREQARLLFEVLAVARGARLSANFNLMLAQRSLGFGVGRRSVVLRPSRRLIGRARRFRARLRVIATDRAGNRTVRTKTIRVRP